MCLRKRAETALLSLILGASLLGTKLASGAEPFQPVLGDPMLEPWRWRAFPELSGLGLRCMAEGRDHKMWFGTVEGVLSYDGVQWTSYAAKDGWPGAVDTLCCGQDGSIYAGGSWGMSRFSNGQWSRLLPSPGQSFGAVWRILVARDGTLWAGTSWGLLCSRGSERVLYTGSEGAALMQTNVISPPIRVELLPAAILSKPRGNAPPGNRSDFYEVYEDRQGRIWLGTFTGEILCFKPSASSPSRFGAIPIGPGGEWTLYNESDGLAVHRRPRILQLENGIIWSVSYVSYDGANQFDGATWKSIRLHDFGVPDDASCPLQTRDGVLWIGCNGAVCANRDGHWQVYEPPRVPIPAVRIILLQTSDGALWVGGQDAEVLRLDYQTARWFTYQNLNFQWESPQGAQWFLHRDGRVVVHNGDRWTSYGLEDGLMDAPTALIGTRHGDIWVVGSHEHTAATARFDGQKWTRVVHDQLSWAVDWRAVLESSDGSVWFGAALDSANLGKNYFNGVMQYRNGQWIHHQFSSANVFGQGRTNVLVLTNSLPASVGQFYGLGQSRDGEIWGGQTVIIHYDGQTWKILPQNQDLRIGTVETICTTKEGDLWIGSRQRGVFRYDGSNNWQHFHVQDGLIANNTRSIAQTTDGTIWVATDRGVSRYDGRNWYPDVLPAALNMAREGGSLKGSPSGALWINRSSRTWNRRAWPRSPLLDTSSCEYWAVCYQLERSAPKTSIVLGPKKVAQPGDITISWKGTDPWRETKDSDLQYSFRLDDGPWSPYTGEPTHTFFSLPSGRHHFEVRARDHAFNADPTPAALDFEVVPPVWQQAWFVGLMVLFTGAIMTQTVRVVLRGRHLRRTNRALAGEVEERKRIELEMEKTHKQLLQASHQAGMAEVATNVLHNVGNVLNSVNVSAEFVTHRIQKSKITDLPKVADLLTKHAHDANFLATDTRGKQIPGYLTQLSDHLISEREAALKELRSLQGNINHIKDIVAMQQEYSRLAGFTESVKLTDLVEDALRLNEGALIRRKVKLARDFQEEGKVVVEKHKVLQILVNLIRNAKCACDESGREDRRLTIRTLQKGAGRVQIQVSDNGVGIAAENLTKIFRQGFTTRKNGHGFGLHSAANAARELGGSLTVHSDGLGKGACFTLEIPVKKGAVEHQSP